MRAWPAAALLLLSAACSSPDPAPTPDAGPPEDAGPVTLTVYPAFFLEENRPLRRLADGDPIELWSAVQGGHVALIAAQISGVAGDTIELRARFTSIETGAIVAEEARTVIVHPVPDDPSLKQNDLRVRSQVTHVPLCPNYDPKPIVDTEYNLEVTVTELYTSPPRKGSAKLRVKPVCGELVADQALCRCECGADYTLGKCK